MGLKEANATEKDFVTRMFQLLLVLRKANLFVVGFV